MRDAGLSFCRGFPSCSALGKTSPKLKKIARCRQSQGTVRTNELLCVRRSARNEPNKTVGRNRTKRVNGHWRSSFTPSSAITTPAPRPDSERHVQPRKPLIFPQEFAFPKKRGPRSTNDLELIKGIRGWSLDPFNLILDDGIGTYGDNTTKASTVSFTGRNTGSGARRTLSVRTLQRIPGNFLRAQREGSRLGPLVTLLRDPGYPPQRLRRGWRCARNIYLLGSEYALVSHSSRSFRSNQERPRSRGLEGILPPVLP